MEHVILRPTKIERRMVSQELTVVIPPCPEPLLRKVQLLISPGMAVVGNATELPEWTGPNRTYKSVPFPSGTTIEFLFGPEQFLTLAVTQGAKAIGIITEYLPLPPNYAATPVPDVNTQEWLAAYREAVAHNMGQ